MRDLHRLRRMLMRQRLIRSSAGTTMVELLVSMVVFSIAMGMIYAVIIKASSITKEGQSSADAVSEVRIALAQIDRQVRSGNVLYSPANEPAALASCTASGTNAGTCMRVYTQANGAERCVQWQVLRETDAGMPLSSAPSAQRALLRSRSWSPRWQTDGIYSTWAVQARGLAPSSPTTQPPFALSSLSGTSNASSSRLLDVQFQALPSRTGAGNVVIAASLSGRNTNYGYDAGLCVPAPPA
jgi:competence protein ComGC